MPVTPAMELLFDRLHNDAPTQQAFLADREAALAEYELTGHERDALMSNDCDDFVAIGLATSTAGLPDVLGCPSVGELNTNILDRLRKALEDALRPIRDRVPIPDRLELPRPWGRRPIGPPEPRPEPPRPRPTPGPDPPKPDRPGGGSGGGG